MKTIEAIISLMVLLSFASLTLIQPPQESSELTKYQLAEDVWRIAYLKGCFQQEISGVEDLAPSDPTNDMEEYCLNPLFQEIHEETGLLIDFSDTFEASAGPNRPGEGGVILHKVVVLNGVPTQTTLAVE